MIQEYAYIAGSMAIGESLALGPIVLGSLYKGFILQSNQVSLLTVQEHFGFYNFDHKPTS